MATLNMIRWQFMRLGRRRGWPVFLAVALLLAAGAVEFQALQWRREARLVEQAIAAVELAPREPVADTQAVSQQRLRTFYETLPQARDSAATVKQLFKIAERSGVTLAQGEYRAMPDTVAKLVRYRISLPVRGEATRIHAFVVDSLNEIRPLTLEGVSFRREKIAAREVDAQLQLILVTRP